MPDITGDSINDVDITAAGSSANIGGVIFTDAVNVGSGTGNYNTFLAISDNDGVEEGFNSDDVPPIDATNKDIDQAKTHTVKLSDLVIVTINGVQYYQVRVDLNEANSDPNAQISLDEFQVYTSTSGTIESTTNLFNPANATLKYDMDAGGDVSVLLSDAESSGSGNDDYSVLIPVSTFAGQDPTTTYVYFYIKMGAAGTDWTATATFEEWNLENGVALTGTKFNDIDGDGIKDAGEGPVAGVTIFIDSNQNGTLDIGERSTVTDANGNYTFFGVALNQTLWIDEVVPGGATQTTGDHETVTISSNATPGSTIVVDPIGNHYLTPHVTIDKTAEFDDGSDCADTVGELINYTVTVTNDGELALSNVELTDSFEGGSDVTITGPDSGDDNGNGLLDVGETWTYTYTHTVTQGDIDSNGGDNGTLDNTATVNGDSANGSVSDDDDASVDVCQDPHITVDKTASVDGDCADTVGELVNYTIDVTNDGNVGLENVDVSDDFADPGSIEAVDADNDTFNDGDTDEDGVLDVGETWSYTAYHTVTQDDIDNNGNYDSDDDGTNDVLRNVATATADALTTGEQASASDDAEVDVCQDPSIVIDKTATVDGDCADTLDELVNYSISVTNDGNVTLENVVVTDDFADPGSIEEVDLDTNGFNDGDTDEDGKLDVGETWLYTAFHTVTQDDIDSGGNYDSDDDQVNDSLRNVATVNADAVTTGETVTDDDDAVVDVCQDISVDLTKYVDVGFGYDDANTGPGPNNVNIGGDVSFKITIENTGNVTLTDVDINDTYRSAGDPGTSNLLIDNGVLTQYAIDHGASFSGDTDGDGDLDVGETWEIIYTEAFDPLSFDPGAHLNTADVTTAEGATDEDDAYYFSLVDDGLCPRTPGFWQNPNNGAQFWDGVAGNEKHAGEDGFPEGELLYAVDSDHDGDIDADDKMGLLIGDYDKDGFTDADEDTLFVSFTDAQTLINASNKQLNGGSGDGRYILGRDMVASWLNYLQGSGFGEADDPESPHHYLDDAIDWMQIYSGKTSGGNAETFDTLKLSGSAIKTNSATWNSPQGDIDHSASQMHSALDYYNNTGQTEPGGTHYANCCDCEDIFQALSVFQQSQALI